MQARGSSDTTFTRRAMLAGTAAGTLALGTGSASAQRCPATPPAREKGPLVWLDMDQHELDEAYDQSVYAFNAKNISARRAANNKKVIAIIGEPQRAAYGPAEIEKVDIWKTKRANAPVLIFIHGGAWRGGRASQVAYIAEPFTKAGAHFVSVDFSNVLETKGDILPMADQCRRAIAWVYKNAASFGGDPEQIYLAGHSSGGHLGGVMLITDWAKYDLSKNPIKGALLGSGMYDLKPVRLSKRGNYVTFTDEMEDALSTQRHLAKIQTPVVLTHGSLETPEFQRQSRDFFAAMKAAGKPVELLVGEGYNHYETQETLGNPYGFMGRAAMEMMKLNAA
ncbi:MAG TPA: alpha/beta hydrolase [Steroidobacteraceae bacterium]|jgi:arylformamidase